MWQCELGLMIDASNHHDEGRITGWKITKHTNSTTTIVFDGNLANYYYSVSKEVIDQLFVEDKI
jgi:hypothetical protein